MTVLAFNMNHLYNLLSYEEQQNDTSNSTKHIKNKKITCHRICYAISTRIQITETGSWDSEFHDPVVRRKMGKFMLEQP